LIKVDISGESKHGYSFMNQKVRQTGTRKMAKTWQ